jgi:arylsulfatase A-like enzyme
VRYTDQEIGRLLAWLRERLGDDWVVLFTSDHGESLGEHGYYFDHGRFGFETCLHVPLILHYPGVLEPRVDSDPVAVMDIGPTILEAAGVPLERDDHGTLWMQARSLTPRLRGNPPPPEDDGHRYVFSEAGYETNDKWEKFVRDERFKLVYTQTAPTQRWYGGQGVRFVLYDLETDPGETENVAEAFPEDLERLKRRLSLWHRAEKFPVLLDTQTCEGDEREMDDQTRELLESLGYL